MRITRSHLLVPLLMITLSAHAQFNSADSLRKVHAPHRIKPNTPSFAPSGYTPAQMRNAYGLNNIVNQGEGQVIALVNAFDHPTAEADLNVFSSTFQLPPCTTANGCFQKLFSNGTKPQPSYEWATEIGLDIQWAHAIAPKAKIMLIEAADNTYGNLMIAVNFAIQKGANVVSMSWGAQEFNGQDHYDPIFNVPNVTFVAASGDVGNKIIYPSSAPHVLAVGGTTLRLDSTGKVISETAWSGSGGGISAYEPKPDHQAQFPIPNNSTNRRGTPDVSYNADPNTGVSVYNTYAASGWTVIGGTSAGSPQWAALIAIAKSSTNQAITDVDTKLYALAKQNYSDLFRDIISGTNGSCGYYCTAQKGYDYVTGLGSPIASALIPALTGGSTPPPPTSDCTITSQCNTWGTPQDSWSGSTCNFSITKPTGLTSPTVFSLATKGITGLTSVWNATAVLANGQVTATLTQPQFVPTFGFNASGIISLPSSAKLTTNGKDYSCTLN